MKARLIESHEIAPEVRHFVFEAGEELNFTPGQWVSFSSQVNGDEVTRAYSVASAPDGRRFELCLNRVREGKFSPWLFEMESGDQVEMKGPLGTFVPRQPASDSVMVATGTGVAPFRAMIGAGFPTDRTLTLIFGVRYEHSILYRTEFEGIARERVNFSFWPTLSRPEPDWQGRRGHVQNHLFEAIGGRREVDVYICGLKAMVDDVRRMLKEAGFERRRILYEKYD